MGRARLFGVKPKLVLWFTDFVSSEKGLKSQCNQLQNQCDRPSWTNCPGKRGRPLTWTQLPFVQMDSLDMVTHGQRVLAAGMCR